MQITVETKNVTKTFEKGKVVAVDNVSISVKKGEIYSLLGPSGSGKSTLLRIIDGLETPDSGDVFIEGECVTEVPAHKRNTCMVFQKLALFPHKTVFDNVAFGLRMRKVEKAEIKRRVEEALRLVELPSEVYADRYPRQLSGGEMQRVALARAIVLRPAVILFDEPLASLDKRLRDRMRVELKQLLKRLNITAIYVTHDQQVAFTISDRIAIMDKGKIMQIGTPIELYERPRSAFIASFIGDTNILKGTVKKIEKDSALIELESGVVIRALKEEGLSSNKEVTVCLRAERILVSRKPLYENSFEATIKEVLYSGENTKYFLTLKSGLELEAKEKTRYQEMFSKGEKVFVNWRPSDVILICK